MSYSRSAPRRKPRSDYRPNREQRKAYFTARWAKLRKQILARDNHLCQDCLKVGMYRTGNQIDHIKPARKNPELFWDPDNLQVLCMRCHTAKTRKGE